MINVVKPDWYKFRAKFSGNPQENFEWFCYMLFCKEYNKPMGIFRYKNQSGVETNPINIESKVIGWQAKFYETTLSNHKKELIETLEKSKRDYPNINMIIFYTNQEWGQGKEENTSKVKANIEEKARDLGIEIVWNTASFFESPFVSIDNRDISSHFFCLEESLIDRVNNKIIPRIEEINKQYKSTFNGIGGKLLERDEVNLCIDGLKNNKSIIIHGKAGQGKSGCTQGIVSYCENNNIPYIAIKLDERTPSCNSDKWGEELGLTTSVERALDIISENDSGVIILDQLDALRWTQVHSTQALITCSEIIRRVEKINLDRKNKISMVFVCRTYDYENDNHIRTLFKNTNQCKENEEKFTKWLEVEVNNLDQSTVRNIVGVRYDMLSSKMKRVLTIPSNLYIWEQLDQDSMYDDYSTTNELIQAWWNQLLENCIKNQISELEVKSAKEEIVNKIDKYGKLYVLCKILNASKASLVYLKSNGFITEVNNKVSFAHQSIADYFLSQKMLNKYLGGEDIIDIIGDKKIQTPQRRYQIQMLLQDIKEIDDNGFINVGIKMLESENVRFYIKYVFLEVLGQSTLMTLPIKKFILKYCEDDTFGNYIVDSVISGHTLFIDLLIENEILDKWMIDDKNQNIVIDLILSLRFRYNKNIINFIRKYLFKSIKVDEKLSKCFSFNIYEDTDEMFKLRIELYDKYPNMLNSYIDLKKLFENSEIKAIKIIEIMLKRKLEERRNIYNREWFMDEFNQLSIKNSLMVLKTLLPYIPKEKELSIISKWNGKRDYNYSIERVCVEIIKKANKDLIRVNPVNFITIYKEFIGKKYVIFNEIILEGFKVFPIKYSNEILCYILECFENIIFDRSSKLNNELELIKLILKKHSAYCEKSIFKDIENKIIYYIDPRAKNIYKRRIAYNRSKEKENNVYWSFWGDLQIELLNSLPRNRMSKKAKDLLDVLHRRFENEYNIYIHSNGHGGIVNSPVTGKKLSNKQWLQILNNKKLKSKEKRNRLIEVENGFVESSIEQFARDFDKVSSLEPERFINLLLDYNGKIDDIFIDSLFSGIAYSKLLNQLSVNLLEKIIKKYGYSYDSYRARNICTIIEKRNDLEWSSDIISILNDIAINHNNPSNDKINITSYDDTEMKSLNMLESNALNCVRGSAATAIGALLCNNSELYTQFKDTIWNLCNDINPAVRLASLETLYPIYNIEKNWAIKNFLSIIEKDYRVIGHRGMGKIILCIYPIFKEKINNSILKCYYSDDKDLIKFSSYILTKLYIKNGEFKELISDINDKNEIQVQSIIEMALVYFNDEEYNKLVKELIRKFINSEFDLEFPMCRLFYDNLIDLKRDREFLIEIMTSNINRRMIQSFVNYLEKNAESIIDYKDIILNMSYSLINNYSENKKDLIVIDDELSKLIIGLYDESLQNLEYNMEKVSEQCLIIWDMMFEKRIGLARSLTQQMLDR
ncbi:hypothetical protein ACSW8X_11160 [Clostridium perfringens]